MEHVTLHQLLRCLLLLRDACFVAQVHDLVHLCDLLLFAALVVVDCQCVAKHIQQLTVQPILRSLAGRLLCLNRWLRCRLSLPLPVRLLALFILDDLRHWDRLIGVFHTSNKLITVKLAAAHL